MWIVCTWQGSHNHEIKPSKRNLQHIVDVAAVLYTSVNTAVLLPHLAAYDMTAN